MSFEAKRMIEADGFSVLRPYLEERSSGLVVTSKGTLARWLQESVGDVLLNAKATDRLFAIELKCEQKHTGRLFLETWSNKNLNCSKSHAERGCNPGWLWKIRSDLLLYYFIDRDILYSLDVFELKRWAFGYGKRGDEKRGRLHEHAEVLVRDDQMNDTWGRPVPVDVLYRQLPAGAIRQTSVVQRTLSEAA